MADSFERKRKASTTHLSLSKMFILYSPSLMVVRPSFTFLMRMILVFGRLIPFTFFNGGIFSIKCKSQLRPAFRNVCKPCDWELSTSSIIWGKLEILILSPAKFGELEGVTLTWNSKSDHLSKRSQQKTITSSAPDANADEFTFFKQSKTCDLIFE